MGFQLSVLQQLHVHALHVTTVACLCRVLLDNIISYSSTDYFFHF